MFSFKCEVWNINSIFTAPASLILLSDSLKTRLEVVSKSSFFKQQIFQIMNFPFLISDNQFLFLCDIKSKQPDNGRLILIIGLSEIQIYDGFLARVLGN